MKTIGMAAVAAAALFAGQAQAATVLFEDFDSETSGDSVLLFGDYDNFQNEVGSTDLIRSGQFSINCVGGTGLCVDLNGGSRGGLVSTQSFAYGAGAQVTLTVLVSGNQRGAPASNSFSYGLLNVDTGGVLAGGTGVLGNDQEAFVTYSTSFTAVSAGNIRARITSLTEGDSAVILDNVRLDITEAVAGVPEPATWAAMVLGFGAAGSSLRRRRAARLAVA